MDRLKISEISNSLKDKPKIINSRTATKSNPELFRQMLKDSERVIKEQGKGQKQGQRQGQRQGQEQEKEQEQEQENKLKNEKVCEQKEREKEETQGTKTEEQKLFKEKRLQKFNYKRYAELNKKIEQDNVSPKQEEVQTKIENIEEDER